MSDYISRESAREKLCEMCRWEGTSNCDECEHPIDDIPAADVRPVPEGGIGEMSDGYHTFNGLYYQRMVLFAALVKAYKDKAWKSHRHEDGELCFGGGWFIVGIDTPKGSYTYHYDDTVWDFFDCEELPTAKHWDGHTEEDVTRLLSLARPVVRGRWIDMGDFISCSSCNSTRLKEFESDYGKVMRLDAHTNFCPNCGAAMEES